MNGRYEKDMKFENKAKNRLMDQPEVLTEYYYSLVGAGKSYATVYNYINYVLKFLKFTFDEEYKCDKEFYAKVKPVHINKYIASLRTVTKNGETKPTSDSIRTVHWSALNTFFQFLVPEYIDTNPVTSTQRPKMKDKPNVTYLTNKEIAKLLKYVEDNASKELKNRDLCILKLGFTTGLRLSAIVQINIEDIDFQSNQIRVVEKGDREEYVMFGEQVRKQLLLWLQDREEYFNADKTDALFVSLRGFNRLAPGGVQEMISKYAKHVTNKHVTPHVMRHSCATNLYEKTGDIYLCASQLHHRNVATTQRYAEISNSRKKEATNILDSLI